METIGDKLKFIRKDKGLTQAEFGESMGLSKQAVSNVENNLSNPSIEFINKLITRHNVNSNWLIADSGQPYNLIENCDLKNEILDELNKILIKKGL